MCILHAHAAAEERWTCILQLPHWLLYINPWLADRAPFRELYSNQTPQLLGHEVPCSLQSLNCVAESDRPLKWCVRPFFLSGCQPHHVWLYRCQTSLYCSYTATAGAHDRKKTSLLFLTGRGRGNEERRTEREGDREGEKKTVSIESDEDDLNYTLSDANGCLICVCMLVWRHLIICLSVHECVRPLREFMQACVSARV